MKDFRDQRREAIESYEDELFEDLVLQTVYKEQTAVEVFRDIVYPEIDLGRRDLIKAKVKYLMDPVQNAKFESKLEALKDEIQASQHSSTDLQLTKDQVLTAWRTLEKSNIELDQKVRDFTRDNPEVLKQMITAFKQV